MLNRKKMPQSWVYRGWPLEWELGTGDVNRASSPS